MPKIPNSEEIVVVGSNFLVAVFVVEVEFFCEFDICKSLYVFVKEKNINELVYKCKKINDFSFLTYCAIALKVE